MPVQTKEGLLMPVQIQEDILCLYKPRKAYLCLYKSRKTSTNPEYIVMPVQGKTFVCLYKPRKTFVSTNSRRYFSVCINPGTYLCACIKS